MRVRGWGGLVLVIFLMAPILVPASPAAAKHKTWKPAFAISPTIGQVGTEIHSLVNCQKLTKKKPENPDSVQINYYWSGEVLPVGGAIFGYATTTKDGATFTNSLVVPTPPATSFSDPIGDAIAEMLGWNASNPPPKGVAIILVRGRCGLLSPVGPLIFMVVTEDLFPNGFPSFKKLVFPLAGILPAQSSSIGTLFGPLLSPPSTTTTSTTEPESVTPTTGAPTSPPTGPATTSTTAPCYDPTGAPVPCPPPRR